MRKLLFLDVDGVLNSERDLKEQGWQALGKDKLDLLMEIVTESHCDIVLSSSWRFFGDAVEKLNKALTERGLTLFGKTPELRAVGRAKEILKWINENVSPEESLVIVILDDERDADLLEVLPHWKVRFFKTSFSFGLTRELAEQAKFFLQQA